METFNGAVFQGEMEKEGFYLTQVKQISTASSLSIDQLMKMAAYLGTQEDSCTITVNDQIPLLLNQEDIKKLLQDLEAILGKIH
ncbi:hypothetical protein [Paucisalibacillus sp. EB02]|uniref:hypothetical protein n=1 Tax=Paucisalibacillus sp. EB02 TaxID=1347087 RepID=UPI0004B0FCF6|nr:hypothetical protein [Paucisalibacillus sp. EB02]